MFHTSHFRRKYPSMLSGLLLPRFLTAMGVASIASIWSMYMNTFSLSESTIGYISSALILVSLLTSLKSTIILEKINESKIFLISILVTALSCLILFKLHNLTLFIIIAIIMSAAAVFRNNSYAIMYRDLSKKEELNSREGLLYSLLNMGWFLGSLFTGLIIYITDLNFVWLANSLIIFLGAILFYFSKISDPKKRREKIDGHIAKNISHYFNKPKLISPYLIAVGMEIWWTFIFLYIPLFVINSGNSPVIAVVFLSLINIPLIFMEFIVGRLSSRFGFRIFFSIGFLSLAVIAMLCYFMWSNIYLVLALLIIASFFASFVEPLQDSFFFSRTRKQDEDKFFPVFATSSLIGNMFSKFFIATLLLFLPEKFSYIAIAIIMLAMFVISVKIKYEYIPKKLNYSST